MNKPTFEQFGLTESEYLHEEKKGDKVTSFIKRLLLLIVITLNIYYLFFYNSTFSLSRIPELLVLNFIGGSILMTWYFIIYMFFSLLISFLFPNLNLLRHSQKYIEYQKALTAFEKEKQDEKLAKEFVDRIRASNRSKIDKQVIESEKILNAYGGAIADGYEQGTALKKSSLPCSVAKIKQAYYNYIEGLIKKDGKLPKDFGFVLVNTYERLSAFIDDQEADEINKTEKLIKSIDAIKVDTSRRQKYFDYVARKINDGDLFDEINEFISECHKKYKRNS